MENAKGRRTLALTSAALFTFFAGAPAFAADQDFTLHNHTARTIKSLYVSPTGADRWSDDILGQDILDNHTDLEVKFDRTGDGCDWDVRVEFADGSSREVQAVDFCAVSDVTFGPLATP